MRSAKRYAFRLSSKALLRKPALAKGAHRWCLRNARNLHRAGVTAINAEALQNLEEELQQTSAAHKLSCCAVHAHLTNQHSQTRGVCLAA